MENFLHKLGKKYKTMNEPMSRQASGGKLGKNGQVYQNDLLDTDYTRQDMGTVRKIRSK